MDVSAYGVIQGAKMLINCFRARLSPGDGAGVVGECFCHEWWWAGFDALERWSECLPLLNSVFVTQNLLQCDSVSTRLLANPTL